MTGKTLLAHIGGIDVEVPGDRNGSFTPRIVRKGQTRLDGLYEILIEATLIDYAVLSPPRVGAGKVRRVTATED
jgi:hypothetical protein